MKNKFLGVIGFLKWSRLDTADVIELDQGYDLEQVFLSPDVNSLHIVWVDPDGDISHEIADYPSDKSIKEFLNEEVGQDSWDMIPAGQVSLIECMNDGYGGNDFASVDAIPVVTLNQLQRFPRR